jgi:hypothetical protein
MYNKIMRYKNKMNEITIKIDRGFGLDPNDSTILWEEKERLRKELEETKAILSDCLEEQGSKPMIDKLTAEIARLQDVVVSLRVQLDYNVDGDARYTANME